MYQGLSEVIMKHDPDAVLLYEPTPFPDTYPSNIPVLSGVHSTGFASPGPVSAAASADPKRHQALAYHIYSCGFAEPNCNRNGDTPQPDGNCATCDEWVGKTVQTRSDDAGLHPSAPSARSAPSNPPAHAPLRHTPLRPLHPLSRLPRPLRCRRCAFFDHQCFKKYAMKYARQAEWGPQAAMPSSPSSALAPARCP